MPNAYKNKVVYNGTTLIDLTADTVTPESLMTGYTAHDASGAAIVGTSTAGTMVIRDTQDSHGGTVREITAGSVVTGTKAITSNGTYDVAAYADASVIVPSPEPELQSKTATPTESQQTVTPDSGYDGLSSVTVGAISSSYVGSGVDRRSSTDLTASGATVTVPAGYYSAQSSKTVASGTAGTPTATKGTVSSNSVSVTPSVTNTTGYITGGTKTGTAVTVSASELVSGTLSITSSGTKDVTNYASATVASGGATASATKGTVSNHSITVTPSVTRTAGYVTAGTANGTAVTVAASELVSGTYTVSSSGTKDVTNYASASVPSGSATASATKGTVSNHSISVTPSVTRTAGYVTAGTTNGTAVTVSASELVSGTLSVTESGTYDVTNYASASVDVQSVSTFTATLVRTDNNTASGFYLNGTGTKHHNNGDVVTFQDGDYLYLYFGGSDYDIRGLYINGALVERPSTSRYDYYPTGDVVVEFKADYTKGTSDIYVSCSSKTVIGSFTVSSTTEAEQVIDIPYTGSGYPIFANVEASGGVYDSGNSFRSLAGRLHIARWSASKDDINNAPTNYATGAIFFTYYLGDNTFNGNGSNGYMFSPYVGTSGYQCVCLNGSTQLRVWVSEPGSYGLPAGASYTYTIVYSG